LDDKKLGRTERSEVMPGNPAPDFALPAVDGQTVALSDLLRTGHNVLLVFLRHLG